MYYFVYLFVTVNITPEVMFAERFSLTLPQSLHSFTNRNKGNLFQFNLAQWFNPKAASVNNFKTSNNISKCKSCHVPLLIL